MADTNPGDGNAETLRRYWQTGPGSIRIAWNTPGDWRRCVANLTKYMGAEDAKGYCNLMHKRMTGMYPGELTTRTVALTSGPAPIRCYTNQCRS